MTGGPIDLEPNYVKKQVILQPLKANLLACVCFLLFVPAALFAFLYQTTLAFTLSFGDFFLFFLAVAVGVIVHELLHGVGFLLSRQVSVADIRFGVVWRKLVLYACCLKPISIGSYRFAVLLPNLLLGVLPLFLAYFFHSIFWYLWSIAMLLGGFGDLYILWTLRAFPKQTKIADSPDSIGYVAYVPDPKQL
ncbi:Protein of unknown function (DUF3267) [Brevibacillus sp. CF112]|uniref:DUF3267 domain-containing protein n=1 Tax=Brevibacillus agri TaxID=51101 RepID=A0A3M8BAL6_9BACL|nr:Protein of unknown function (DUF3267) [Brevibacillus sp. CF112]ELK40421.1 hypothetical protein D478_19474 [Brevibacillus agri BAB-2500]MBG9568610.1 hypothetical protein [Brevibacillus agri]QHZ57569.1 DUF3267 domain-containing protein [Brevibacillus sp. NSP2.1]MBY0053019.1 DUF3267 domain-containing protein [Brevibacillus agri]